MNLNLTENEKEAMEQAAPSPEAAPQAAPAPQPDPAFQVDPLAGSAPHAGFTPPEPPQAPQPQEPGPEPPTPPQPPQRDRAGKRRRPPTAPAGTAPARTPRRVGTFTLGVALIITGVLLILFLFRPNIDPGILLWVPPLLLIALGVEILLRYCFSKDHSYKYDVLSAFICFLLICGSVGAACLPRAMEYWGPKRHQAEQARQDQIYDDCYRALKDNQGIASLRVFTDVYPLNGEYVPQFTQLHISFITPFQDEESFAAAARQILDKVLPLGYDFDNISFEYSGDDVSCRLDLRGDFQFNMDVQHLALLAEVTINEPEPVYDDYDDSYDDASGDSGEPEPEAASQPEGSQPEASQPEAGSSSEPAAPSQPELPDGGALASSEAVPAA